MLLATASSTCPASMIASLTAGSFRSRSISLGFLGLLFAGIPVGFEFGCGLCFVRAALFGGEGFGVGSISLGASGFLGSFCGGIDSGLLFGFRLCLLLGSGLFGGFFLTHSLGG